LYNPDVGTELLGTEKTASKLLAFFMVVAMAEDCPNQTNTSVNSFSSGEIDLFHLQLQYNILHGPHFIDPA